MKKEPATSVKQNCSVGTDAAEHCTLLHFNKDEWLKSLEFRGKLQARSAGSG